MNRHERETGCDSFRGMASDEKRRSLPDRMRRRDAWRHPDPLVWKRAFACGEAAKRGCMLVAWENPFMRPIMRRRIEASRALGPLPIPEPCGVCRDGSCVLCDDNGLTY